MAYYQLSDCGTVKRGPFKARPADEPGLRTYRIGRRGHSGRVWELAGTWPARQLDDDDAGWVRWYLFYW